MKTMRTRDFKKGLKKALSTLLLGLVGGLLSVSLFALPVASALDLEIDLGLEDAICDSLGDDGVVSCADEESTSFTDFDGSFEAPSDEGYAEGITTTDSAREFIVNVTNFVLGFLGLAAIVVIIYSGFLYVTAAGESDRADKGKKGIQYAIMGIIIVLMSYAVVNTIIRGAGTGESDPESTGLYSAGDVSSESLTEFQASQMASNLQDLTEDFINAYTAYTNVVAIIDAMANVGTFDEDGLEEMEEGFELILDQVDSFSTAADESRLALQFIRNYVSFDFNERLQTLVDSPSWGSANIFGSKVILAQETEDSGDVDPYGVGTEVITYMGTVVNHALSDFMGEMDDIRQSLEDMMGSFEGLENINTYFETALNELEDYDSLGNYDSSTYSVDGVSGSFQSYMPQGGSRQVGDIVEILNELYAIVQDLEFTTAVITANTDEGNAPLIVVFDGLESYDPSNLTISDDNYEWDLYGVGFDSVSSPVTGPVVSAEYDGPGTYRVGLRVTSSSENIAAGISYLSVTVNPPSSIIQLTGTTESQGNTTDLSQATSWVITKGEAEGGLTFDASGTTDGDGNEDTIINYSFDFGDGESQEGENETATHYYSEEGTYEFVLEVTDQNGTEDRKILDVVVASPAAHLSVADALLEIDEPTVFDGSGSLTDNGRITQNSWLVVKDGKTVYSDENGEDELEIEFEEPGVYQVTLTVTDSSGQSNSTSAEVEVQSTAPSAVFNYAINDKTRPNRVYLYGENSYDPDEGDEVSFEWNIPGTEGSDYEFVLDTDSSSANPVIDLYATGDWEIELTVSDQHPDHLQQSDQITKSLTIDSILTIDIENNGDAVLFLSDDGEATAELTFSSSTGVSYEVDWADGSDVETIPSTGGSEDVSHTYNEAGTYIVNVTVYDSEGDTNSLTQGVFVGNGETPIPVISITLDDLDQETGTMEIEGTRVSNFQFDASDSVDLDGKSLPASNFSWNLGDGTISNNQKSVSYQYDEVGTFEVTLKADSETDSSANASTSITVNIVEVEPQIYGVVVTPVSDELVTPAVVKVEVNAEDIDGQNVLYEYSYYDVSKSAEIIGKQTSESSTALITINTNGDTGEEIEYGFLVEVTDNENNTASSSDVLEGDQIPTIEVENGPNQAPIADFSVDRTNVTVGESVTFTSRSTDEDGDSDDFEYIWDFEGDGFYNNDTTSLSTTTHTFDSAAPDGIEVRLKVTDDKGATGVSDPVRIYVDSLIEDPVAAFNYQANNFEITFENNSYADTEHGGSIVSYEWDMDTNTDSDGDGTKDNDVDSTEESPVHTYEDYGTYRVKLTITDNEGNTDDVTQSVRVIETDPPEAAFTYDVEEFTVDFANNSTVAGDTVTIVSYEWDFDASEDTDGNGEEADDADSTEENPSHTYEDYGEYDVVLTVTDSLGRTDSVSRTVEIEEPEGESLVAYLTSDPEASQSDGKIHLDGDSGSITFSFEASGGVGEIEYCIDKNVYYDSDGDGDKDNDCNHEASSAGDYSTNFEESWGLIVVKLTITDEQGNTDSVTREVKFDDSGSSLATSVLPVTSMEALYILATAMGFTILGVKLYTRREEQEIDLEL